MNQEPYAPPNEIEPILTQRSIIHVLGFLLSSLLAFAMLLGTIFLAYQCVSIAGLSDLGWRGVPTYTMLLPVLSLFCGLAMAWSAVQWHRIKAGHAISFFTLSMVSMFLVPRVLLSILF